ncbi:hypothetical protein ABZ929_25500 [Streptomyces physcomitrii]|uniref:hypothetical protein n=1 Tax=Streptomyces physcomitrii TaxID=2724184 RepID=UPI00341E567E
MATAAVSTPRREAREEEEDAEDTARLQGIHERRQSLGAPEGEVRLELTAILKLASIDVKVSRSDDLK